MSHPYRGLPSHQFWNTGVTQAPPGALDPMTSAKFQIEPGDQVATMGSCFAQHISRHLVKRGLSYFIAEQGDPHETAEANSARNYGVFSARYGNVYTVRQGIQLIDRAFGEFIPSEQVWETVGGFVDPYRPQIEPKPWGSPEQVVQSREEHLEAVRRIFLESDVLVFTLGLTETFISKGDGSVFPVAPGVSGGSYSDDQYTFINFGVNEVIADLHIFIAKARKLNPNLRIILTVSPVPLIATFEPRHVLVSTTISKATLRVAADEITKLYPFVEYFPSYEIISGSAIGAPYFEPDLRQVRQVGVDHVMRIFEKHMLQSTKTATAFIPDTAPATNQTRNVVCDEETIMNTLNASGLPTSND
jgi:hypothetical protein